MSESPPSSHSPQQPADHRQLGRSLKLFASFEEIGAGLPVWLPDGAALRGVLEQYVLAAERQAGYQHVYSPVLAKRSLYEKSGHWQHYHDDMFPPMQVGNEEVVLRPMLCPHHALIYQSEPRSYRHLPIRIGEIGGQYRNELSGSLGGLSRVRAMALNDGHLFVRPDQLAQELRASLELIQQASQDLGIDILRYRLSLGGDGNKFVNDAELWSRAQHELEAVLQDMGLAYEAEPNEAAFYGPKIDVQVLDAGGREVSWSTVQLDFLMAERFDLSYIGEDGQNHRPVVIHRSMVGAMERVVAHLIERWQGAFPYWLAPVQAVVLPVNDNVDQYSQNVVHSMAAAGIRVQRDGDDLSLGQRIHRNRQSRVPFLVVVGSDEAASGSVSVRDRDGNRYGPMAIDQLVSALIGLSASRSLELSLPDN